MPMSENKEWGLGGPAMDDEQLIGEEHIKEPEISEHGREMVD